MASARSLFGQLLLVAGFVGCSPVAAVDKGRDLYADPRLSISPSNVFACATCHDEAPAAKTDDPASRHYPGYTMYGAAQRPSYWNGQMQLLLDAVNFCYVQFMAGEQLAPDDEQGLALLAYLQSLAPAPDPAQPLTVVKNIDPTYVATLSMGDPQRGATLYGSSCAPCHGDLHTGNGRLGRLVSIIPDDTVKLFGAMARGVVAEKVRHGKFFEIGGSMPPYALEVLTDHELADLLAYLLP